ncbi:MAG: hypothetical protein M3Q64_00375 [bacterium]|nr:hypothetical protein [bacterium]
MKEKRLVLTKVFVFCTITSYWAKERHENLLIRKIYLRIVKEVNAKKDSGSNLQNT